MALIEEPFPHASLVVPNSTWHLAPKWLGPQTRCLRVWPHGSYSQLSAITCLFPSRNCDSTDAWKKPRCPAWEHASPLRNHCLARGAAARRIVLPLRRPKHGAIPIGFRWRTFLVGNSYMCMVAKTISRHPTNLGK